MRNATSRAQSGLLGLIVAELVIKSGSFDVQINYVKHSRISVIGAGET